MKISDSMVRMMVLASVGAGALTAAAAVGASQSPRQQNAEFAVGAAVAPGYCHSTSVSPAPSAVQAR